MRTFEQKQNSSQPKELSELNRSSAQPPEINHQAYLPTKFQCASGNQAVQRLMQGKTERLEKNSGTTPAGIQPNTDWENDKSVVGKDIYYNTEVEANIRKAEIESEGKWEEYAVESFTKDGITYWRVRMHGTRTIVNFLSVLRKAEKAYSSWTKEQMLNSLRRLGGYDNEKFQTMYGTTAAGDLVAIPNRGFNAIDLRQLKEMVGHEISDYKETGIVKDLSGQYLAMGHVMTGISGGLHRKKEADLTPLYSFAAGEKMDNLYAATIAGDLGQSAVLVNAGIQHGYIGPGTEATDAELVGDIDGYLIGETFTAADLKKKWDETRNLSDFIEAYYKSTYRERFIEASKIKEADLIDQVTRFAETYAYTLGNLRGAFSNVGTESKASYKEYKDWLSKKKIKENEKPRAKLMVSADNVHLVSDPSNYSETIDCKLMHGAKAKLIDDGAKMSFNQVEEKYKWTKVLVMSGENEGKIGWVSRMFLKSSF